MRPIAEARPNRRFRACGVSDRTAMFSQVAAGFRPDGNSTSERLGIDRRSIWLRSAWESRIHAESTAIDAVGYRVGDGVNHRYIC